VSKNLEERARERELSKV
jgi:hypothetical protein